MAFIHSHQNVASHGMAKRGKSWHGKPRHGKPWLAIAYFRLKGACIGKFASPHSLTQVPIIIEKTFKVDVFDSSPGCIGAADKPRVVTKPEDKIVEAMF